MSGLGEHFPAFQFGGAQVAPRNIDRYEYINTGILSISATWVGTAAGGTSTQAKTLVLINKLLDYPRNLLYSCVGTNDMGGTWVVNGIDQFGQVIQETVTNGTVAAGTPAFAVAGTKIFAEVKSGTFTVTTGAVGAGSARIGVAVGTAGTLAFKLGLLSKIEGSTDVKSITWVKENTVTTLNGGTIGAYVDTTNHAITGSAVMGGTESYKIIMKPTFDNLNKTNLAAL
jgi:hypothetical protein